MIVVTKKYIFVATVQLNKSNEDMILALAGAPASQRSWVRIPLSHLNFSGS